MKRSTELAVLSREHHVALELALRLQRATAADADDLRSSTLCFWRDEGREHFRLEEELLLPAFARHAGTEDSDIVRVLVEHVDIRRRIADLQRDAHADHTTLNALGKLLHDHVRHEERTLFVRIETALDTEELRALGAAMQSAASEQQPARDQGA